jgi:hypothetical protein
MNANSRTGSVADMSLLDLRKVVVQLEETNREAGRQIEPPTRKVVAAAAIANPYAGRYVNDLTPLYALGADVAELLARRAMGLDGERFPGPSTPTARAPSSALTASSSTRPRSSTAGSARRCGPLSTTGKTSSRRRRSSAVPGRRS